MFARHAAGHGGGHSFAHVPAALRRGGAGRHFAAVAGQHAVSGRPRSGRAAGLLAGRPGAELGLYQIRLLNLVPIARSAIVENMPDGVMVLDDKDRVIDCNPAALQLLGAQLNAVLGQPVAEVLQTRRDLLDRYSTLPKAQDEIVLNDRICELRIAPMSDRLGRTTGRLIMVRDVTERIRSADELDQRTAEFRPFCRPFPT